MIVPRKRKKIVALFKLIITIIMMMNSTKNTFITMILAWVL